ncbi:hypothetical protein I4U23_009315 [Adineta vaga]|nr:hypothetical protein I4U23_009315 [Adineta vaga]
MLSYKHDPLVSLLHVIQKQSSSKEPLKNELIQKQSQHVTSTKSISCKEFQLRNKTNISSYKYKKSRQTPERISDNLQCDIKPQSYLGSQNFDKVDHRHYIFEGNNSFYPARVPIKYGFQIRSLIEYNHLPSWQFSDNEKNQIIYKSQSNKDDLPQIISSLSSKVAPNSSLSNNPSIQSYWINPWLNSRQLKEQQKQLSIYAHRDIHPSSKSTILISNKVPQNNILLQNNQSDKRHNQRRCTITRRKRCITFDEHLQRYYSSRWCLTSTR